MVMYSSIGWFGRIYKPHLEAGRMDVDSSDVIPDFVIDFYFPDYYNLFWQSNNKALVLQNTSSKVCDGGGNYSQPIKHLLMQNLIDSLFWSYLTLQLCFNYVCPTIPGSRKSYFQNRI